MFNVKIMIITVIIYLFKKVAKCYLVAKRTQTAETCVTIPFLT